MDQRIDQWAIESMTESINASINERTNERTKNRTNHPYRFYRFTILNHFSARTGITILSFAPLLRTLAGS